MLLANLARLWIASARTQAACVASVVGQGGSVSYAYERPLPDGSYRVGATPPGPAWLRDWLGIDYFTSVYAVTLDHNEIRDIEPLTRLPHLEHVMLWTYITPEVDLTHLKRIERLKTLHLGYTALSPEQIAEIRAMLPECEVLVHEEYGAK